MTSLHVEVLAAPEGAGADEALPLVLLHGFTGDATTWRRLLPHLGSERAIVAVDLVGHGRSPDPKDPTAYTMPAVVASVAASIAPTLRARGHGTAHWLGYSMGGRVALGLAAAHPALCASLALVGASPGLADPSDRAARVAADEAEALVLERDGMEAFVTRWMRLPLFRSQEALGHAFLAEARAQRLANRPRALAACLRGMGTGVMPSLWDDLEDMRMPILLVAGGLDDKFVGIGNRMADRLPAGRRMVVAGVGHAVHLEAPGALGAATVRFLEEVERGRASGERPAKASPPPSSHTDRQS